jgi:hypothetical protein
MIVYRLMPDGGFVAGDTATERTSYAYPTSTYATRAKRTPRGVAAEMMEHENQALTYHLEDRRQRGETGPVRVLEFDTRNWVLLNETRFPKRPVRGISFVLFGRGKSNGTIQAHWAEDH